MNSDLRLQIVDKESGKTYPKDKKPNEVHFLTMEGVLGSANLKESIWNFRHLMHLMVFKPDRPASDWHVVDFDNFLQGNPHVQKVD